MVPTSLSHGIKLVNPMFRGYAQQVGRPGRPGHTQSPYPPGLALKPRLVWRMAHLSVGPPLPDPCTCEDVGAHLMGRLRLRGPSCLPRSPGWYLAEGKVDIRLSDSRVWASALPAERHVTSGFPDHGKRFTFIKTDFGYKACTSREPL